MGGMMVLPLCVLSHFSGVQFFVTLCPWDSPGKNNGVGGLLCSPGEGGIFPTQGLPLVPLGKPDGATARGKPGEVSSP